MATLIGARSDRNSLIERRSPRSITSKSFCLRSFTSRPLLSRTVALTVTRSTPDRNVACFSAASWAHPERGTSVRARAWRIRRMHLHNQVPCQIPKLFEINHLALTDEFEGARTRV